MFLSLFHHLSSTLTNSKANFSSKKERLAFLQSNMHQIHIRHKQKNFKICIHYFSYQDKVVLTARSLGSNIIMVHYVPSKTESDKHHEHRTTQSTWSSKWSHGGVKYWEARFQMQIWGKKSKGVWVWRVKILSLERKKERGRRYNGNWGWRQREKKDTIF